MLDQKGWTLLLFALDDERAAEEAARIQQEILSSTGLRTFVIATKPRERDARLVDGLGWAAERFGVDKPAAVLVRPDHVIGYRGRLSDERLDGYLVHVGIGRLKA